MSYAARARSKLSPLCFLFRVFDVFVFISFVSADFYDARARKRSPQVYRNRAGVYQHVHPPAHMSTQWSWYSKDPVPNFALHDAKTAFSTARVYSRASCDTALVEVPGALFRKTLA